MIDQLRGSPLGGRYSAPCTLLGGGAESWEGIRRPQERDKAIALCAAPLSSRRRGGAVLMRVRQGATVQNGSNYACRARLIESTIEIELELV